jgi:formate dehydrogenase iron-sulfur subunit
VSLACLVDTTKCIGCRACQVACKHWNDLRAEATEFRGYGGGYQNPPALSARTYTLISYHEVEAADAPGGLRWIFAKHQCLHCNEPACVAACPVTALERSAAGPVTYDDRKCIGCRYCVLACPFGVPTAEWDTPAPRIKKCTFCCDRVADGAAPDAVNDAPLDAATRRRWAASQRMPACIKVCPTQALTFGERDALITEAWRRIEAAPERYHRHVYGEKEAGGTAWMYLAAVPFGKLGFRTDLGERGYPRHADPALRAVPAAVVGLGALLGGIYWFAGRRAEVAAEAEGESEA